MILIYIDIFSIERYIFFSNRLKLDFVLETLLQNFVEKQRKYAKYCEQFKTVSDLAQSLRKIQRSMDEIVPMMKEINDILPENEQLEEFSFKWIS